MRSKEEVYDYATSPEPDLVVLDPSPEWLEAARGASRSYRRRGVPGAAAATGAPASSDAVTVVRLDLDVCGAPQFRRARTQPRGRSASANEVAAELPGGRLPGADDFAGLVVMDKPAEPPRRRLAWFLRCWWPTAALRR